MRKFETSPDNEPLPRAGVYMLVHRESGKKYIGISANVMRRLREHETGGSPRKLKLAIKKHGAESFTASPVYYSIGDGTGHLPEIESNLILLHSSYDSGGYNVKIADGGVGPYGPEFGKLISDHHSIPENKMRMVEATKKAVSTPEVRAKISAGVRANWENPEIRAKMVAALTAARNRPEILHRYSGPEASLRNSRISRAAMADPDVRAKISESGRAAWGRADRMDLGKKASKAAWENPETRAKHTASRIKRWSDPKNRAKMSKAISGLRWVNDGAKNARLKPADSIPDGWSLGRIGGGAKGLVWITDGNCSRRIQKLDQLPDGWRYGNATKGKPKPRKKT